MLASEEAFKARAMLSAIRYCKNAYKILSKLPKNIKNNRKMLALVTRWAETTINLSDYKHALKMLRHALKLSLNKYEYIKVQNMIVGTLLLVGELNKAKSVIKKGAHNLRISLPLGGWLSYVQAFFDLFKGIIFQVHGEKNVSAIIQSLRRIKTDNNAIINNEIVTLYRYCEEISLTNDKRMWLLYHCKSFNVCMNHPVSLELFLITLAQRALIYGFIGFRTKAYKLLDFVVEQAEVSQLFDVVTRIQLMKIAVLDQMKGRAEENAELLSHLLPFLSKADNRELYASAYLMKMSSDFFSGKIKDIVDKTHLLKRILPVGNGISIKIKSLQIFSLFLLGSRDRIVYEGDNFLREYFSEQKQGLDFYVKIIQTFIATIKGEKDKARKSFSSVLVQFIHGEKKQFYFPYEYDFILFFLLVFPDLFFQEHGYELMRSHVRLQMVSVLSRFSRKKIAGDRPVSALVSARDHEFRKEKNFKKEYFQTILSGKMDNQNLVLYFAYLWFGKVLYTSGNRQRIDYIRKVHKDASDSGVNLIVSLAEKIMRELKVNYTSSVQSVVNESKKEERIKSISNFVYSNFNFMRMAAEQDLDLNVSVKKIIQNFGAHHKFTKISCILIKNPQEELETCYSSGESIDFAAVQRYVSPYLSIRATLFLPVNDAPWYRRGGLELSTANTSSTTHRLDSLNNDNNFRFPSDSVVKTAIDELAVVKDDAATVILHGTSAQNGELYSSQTLNQANRKNDSKMKIINIIVPLRYETHNCGVIFIEGFSESDHSVVSSRSDLDMFGLQLGYLVFRKKRKDMFASSGKTEVPPPIQPLAYLPGEYQLEPVDWINLWTKGFLRKDRESTWYLGLNLGSEEYLLTYCRLNGPEQVRAEFSSVLWHFFTILRSRSLTTGHNQLQVAELSEEMMSLLRSRKNFTELENVSISFTLFNKFQQFAYSGHFGPSRPLVLHEENEVAPDNEFAIELKSGRFLRYWEVKASMNHGNVYMMTHDSSKLDEVFNSNKKASTSRVPVKRTNSPKTILKLEDVEEAMKRNLLPECIPRYYVAAVFPPSFVAEDTTLDNQSVALSDAS